MGSLAVGDRFPVKASNRGRRAQRAQLHARPNGAIPTLAFARTRRQPCAPNQQSNPQATTGIAEF